MTYTLDEIRAKVKPVVEKYDVKEMYLFGSYARGEADEVSDLDFAVQDEGTKLVGAKFFSFEIELEDTLGLPVDVVSLDCVYQPVTRFPNRFAPKFERDKVAVI